MSSAMHFCTVFTLSSANPSATGLSACTIPAKWALSRNVMAYPPSTVASGAVKQLVRMGSLACSPQPNWVRWAYLPYKKCRTIEEAEAAVKEFSKSGSDCDTKRVEQLQRIQATITTTKKKDPTVALTDESIVNEKLLEADAVTTSSAGNQQPSTPTTSNAASRQNTEEGSFTFSHELDISHLAPIVHKVVEKKQIDTMVSILEARMSAMESKMEASVEAMEAKMGVMEAALVAKMDEQANTIMDFIGAMLMTAQPSVATTGSKANAGSGDDGGGVANGDGDAKIANVLTSLAELDEFEQHIMVDPILMDMHVRKIEYIFLIVLYS